MATIGTFTAADNGYTGSVKTLTLNVKAKFTATEKENEGAGLSHLRRLHRIRRGLEEDRARQRSRISLSQARRSELPGPDLRLAGEGRGRRQLYADLVPSQRRLIQPDRRAPPLRRRGFSCAHGHNDAERREDLRSLFRKMIAMGSALARARVKHLTVPAGAVSPVFRSKAEFTRRPECQARADARVPRAPVGG